MDPCVQSAYLTGRGGVVVVIVALKNVLKIFSIYTAELTDSALLI